MKSLIKLYVLIVIQTILLVLFINTAYAGDSKGRLIKSIEVQQRDTEKNIVNLWMSGERGKKLELALSEYIALEVRHRALGGKSKNKSLLIAVSGDPKYKPDNPIDLAREVVLEYFKRKGIDLKDQRFVKGNYYLK
ncbi:MAG TPA: hypothetical protein QF753_15085 [Victivallales bacterium]|nr:hypothetical protein [Victivallales bacterium]